MNALLTLAQAVNTGGLGNILWIAIVALIIFAVIGSPLGYRRGYSGAAGWGLPGGLLGLVVILVLLRIAGII